MRDCRVCGMSMSVPGIRGPATCPHCRREKYLIVKRRYQQTPKGIATARAREEREEVREKRRQFSRSIHGKRNQVKYERTEKGRRTRRRAQAKYQKSLHGRLASAARHLRAKDDPIRRAQKRKANHKYRKTENGKALARRQHAQRRGAILATDNRLRASDWLEIVKKHKGRCYYCKTKNKLTMDHVFPVSKGGQHTKENVVPACGPCNSRKRDRIVLLF